MMYKREHSTIVHRVPHSTIMHRVPHRIHEVKSQPCLRMCIVVAMRDAVHNRVQEEFVGRGPGNN